VQRSQLVIVGLHAAVIRECPELLSEELSLDETCHVWHTRLLEHSQQSLVFFTCEPHAIAVCCRVSLDLWSLCLQRTWDFSRLFFCLSYTFLFIGLIHIAIFVICLCWYGAYHHHHFQPFANGSFERAARLRRPAPALGRARSFERLTEFRAAQNIPCCVLEI